MQVDYWAKARQGRIIALTAMRRLADGCGQGRTPRPPELGLKMPSDEVDQTSTPVLSVVAS